MCYPAPKIKFLKFFIFISGKWKLLNKTKNILIFSICKEPGYWGKSCFWLRSSWYLQPPSQYLQDPPNSQEQGSKELQRLLPVLLLNQLRETTLQTGNASLSSLIPELHSWCSAPPHRLWSSPCPGAVKWGVSNKPQWVPISEPTPFCLSTLIPIPFSFVPHSSFIGLRVLRKIHQNSFLPKGEIILESELSNQNRQPGKLNEPLTSFICSDSDNTTAESEDTDHLPYWVHPWWTRSSTSIGRIHSVPPIKTQIPQNLSWELMNIL